MTEFALERTGRVRTSVAIVEPGEGSGPRTLAFLVPAHRKLETRSPGNRWPSPSRFELAVLSPIEEAYCHRAIFERECYLCGSITLDGRWWARLSLGGLPWRVLKRLRGSPGP